MWTRCAGTRLQLKTSWPSSRAPWHVLDNPSPREVDARSLHITFFWDSMLVVLLTHTLHCTEVAVIEDQLLHRALALLREIRPQLELPASPERKRNNAYTVEFALEQSLIVR